MSPAESADVVIEMDAVNGELGPDLAALDCPTVFVVGISAFAKASFPPASANFARAPASAMRSCESALCHPARIATAQGRASALKSSPGSPAAISGTAVFLRGYLFPA
jgi:hypothetical protein